MKRLWIAALAGTCALALVVPSGAGAAEEMKAKLEPFKAMDKDQNGKVTPKEWTVAWEARFVAMDVDKDGKVTPQEFKAYFETRFQEWDVNGDKVLKADESYKLTRYDIDQDGKVTPEEYTGYFAKRWAVIDKDGNMFIYPNEFEDYFNALFREWDVDGDSVLTEDEAKEVSKYGAAAQPEVKPPAEEKPAGAEKPADMPMKGGMKKGYQGYQGM